MSVVLSYIFGFFHSNHCMGSQTTRDVKQHVFIGASLSKTHLVRCMTEVTVVMSVIRTFTR